MKKLEKVPVDTVPTRRGSPFLSSVDEIVDTLMGDPMQWYMVAEGDVSEDRSRLYNAAAGLRSGRYRALGRLEGHGAMEAVAQTRHGKIRVYAKYVPGISKKEK